MSRAMCQLQELFWCSGGYLGVNSKDRSQEKVVPQCFKWSVQGEFRLI